MTDSGGEPAGPLVRDISDTARWVATYRARETERPDAVFRDPFARRLAGERGEQIARAQPFSEQNAWAFVTRTYLFDRFIAEDVASGADLVLNLAAGLDARPYRMDLPPTLQWVEVDLPGILDYKEPILAEASPRCALERVRLDLSDVAARRALFKRIGSSASRVTVVTEGLLIYLSEDEVTALGQDLAAIPAFRHWILDIVSPGLVKIMSQRGGQMIAAAGAPYKFGPLEGVAFFERAGWRATAQESVFKTAGRIGRHRLLFKLLSLLPESERGRDKRPWSAVCRMERTGQGVKP